MSFGATWFCSSGWIESRDGRGHLTNVSQRGVYLSGHRKRGHDRQWVLPVFQEVWRVMADDSLCVTFYGWPQVDVFVEAWKRAGLRLVSHLAFIKSMWG